MLRLKNIVKEYEVGDEKVPALKGVSLEFRENEFVSILGPSGCGKTTLLNIIGGLDKYTSGDLIINGISTKLYKDRNWDSYRNHSIGFVFQSYNLIPHQTVLANVELALTLSGVSRRERRKRAVEALEKVGLKDQIRKKPNQLSGGQMQRVAIARALVNDPDILLADEPTGALDTATSAQIMDILSEIAEDKLVIMVTHNPELAQVYSTRIIKLLDGEIQSDSMPVTPEEIKADEEKAEAFEKMTKQERKALLPPKTSMSLATALTLSLNNLMTKKARTLLTAFAGSIGIIGIALILSLSNGVQQYIDRVQEDTLSNYPITIERSTIDVSSFMSSVAKNANEITEHTDDRIYTNQIMTGFMELMVNEVTTNNLADFKQFIEANRSRFEELTTDIHYGYSTRMNVYKADIENGIYQVNPGQVFSMMGMRGSSSRMSFVNSEV
ncbi:MAG: ABC transporter ATP-binding protein [Lachnospiraceae bacterium]|nr:ABC transporter ATP-binding protein [Lachnospiraceae bacterium]